MKNIYYLCMFLSLAGISTSFPSPRSVFQTKYGKTIEIVKDENWVAFYEDGVKVGQLRVWPHETVRNIDWVQRNKFKVTTSLREVDIILADPMDASIKTEKPYVSQEPEDATVR